MSGSRCGSSGEEQGRGERDQNRALSFPLALNIASACLARPLRIQRMVQREAGEERVTSYVVRVAVLYSWSSEY